MTAVITQLRFDPILKIGTGVPDFQDEIRDRFPLYEERDVRVVDVDLAAGVRARQSKEHRFMARKEPTTVVLGDRSVALEYRAHQHRDVLFPDVARVTAALTRTYKNVSPTRLGVRYVNAIDRDAIAAATGAATAWPDLVEASFLQMPGQLANLDGTRFAHEITSEMPTGTMTLRYAMIPGPQDRLVFRLDIDRYREESFEVRDVENTVKGFVDDIFQVFMAAAGEALLTWMGEVSP